MSGGVQFDASIPSGIPGGLPEVPATEVLMINLRCLPSRRKSQRALR
ncbi:hypothetical protein [Endozoicomonas numazuensis]|nr:hypothetical protein [Endozoicomonas numazuensis]